MMACCSSKPRKGSGMKRRAAHQRPGMRAEQLPPPMQGAGEPTGSVGGSSSPLQAPPPAPPHSPEEEEALTPALLSADNVEVRIDDDGVAPALAAPAVEAAPAAAAAAVWTATEPVALGSYEADKAAALGTGSFGVVVRGVVLETGEGVAIKLVPMPTRRAAGEEEGEEDYDSVRREAVIGGALQHRNIARLFACVYRPGDTASLETLEGVKPCSSGTLYMVQELAGGRDMFWLWWESSSSHRLAEDRARFFGCQLLDAMLYLQSVGICHRDLKLQNLLLDADQRTLKLSDFGTAVVGGMTNAAGVGTPCMWAPELWLADECDGHKLDMWACGLMLYQLVAGTLPFDDIDFEQELDPQRLMFLSETISNFGSAAGSAAGPPLPAGCGELSAPLRQLLAGLLQPAPYRRMTAAQALEEPWCHAECSVADSQLKEAGYTASAATVRAVVEAGLGTEDPDRWAGRQPGQTPSPQQQQRQSLVPATPEEQPQLQQEKEKEKEKEGEEEEVERAEVDELDAVQAEIAKLKAEMGL